MQMTDTLLRIPQWKSMVGITFLGLLALPAHSDGPTFNVTLSVQNAVPIFQLLDDDADESNWAISVDRALTPSESFSIFNGESGRSVFIIENGAPASALRIDDQGRVGMGTAAPAEELHITSAAPAIRLEETSQTWDLFSNSSQIGIFDVTNGATPFVIRSNAGTAALLIDTGGNVGFSTISPTEAVDVVRDGAGRFQLSSFSSTATDAAQFIQRRARGNQAAPAPVQTGDNIGLFSFRGMRPNGLFSGSKAFITVQATENWGNASNGTSIKFGTTQNGTNTFSTVMEITHDKKVKINGTDLNVPDYVFEDEYDLMPLDELKAFIHQHKHLPDVASTEQIKREGVDLGSSQMVLLQKIEELTLYTLQQEARIRKQNSELTRQQSEINELRRMKGELIQLRGLVDRLAANDQLAAVN